MRKNKKMMGIILSMAMMSSMIPVGAAYADEQTSAAETNLAEEAQEPDYDVASYLAAGTNTLYYWKEGAIYKKNLESEEETVLIQSSEESGSVGTEFLMDGDLLYYVLNRADKSEIVCFNTFIMNGETIQTVENHASQNGEMGETTDVGLMGLYGNHLVYKSGEWFNYTAHVMNLTDRTVVDMMENVGNFIGAYQDHYVFMDFSSDISPRNVIVYDKDGAAVFGCRSYGASYLNSKTGDLYFRDDNAYMELQEKYNKEDPDYTAYEEELAQIQSGPSKIMKYSVAKNEVTTNAELGTYYEYKVDYDGLLFATQNIDEATSVMSSVPVDQEDAASILIDWSDRTFRLDDVYYVVENQKLYRMDFQLGSLVEEADLTEMLEGLPYPGLEWCEVPQGEDSDGTEELAYYLSYYPESSVSAEGDAQPVVKVGTITVDVPETAPAKEETTAAKEETTVAEAETTEMEAETTTVEAETTTVEEETTTVKEETTTVEEETTTVEEETTTVEKETTTEAITEIAESTSEVE